MKQCIGCGYCCMKVVCTYGQMEYEVDPISPCPGLYWDGGKYRCHLIEENESVARALGAGEGCSSVLTGWREEVKRRMYENKT